MLRITSINLNGIRSAFRKGLQPWMQTHSADVLCLQEIKIADDDLTEDLRHPPGYTGHFCHATKKGYSGVGMYLRNGAERVQTGMNCEEFDAEGRIIRADWKNLSVISAYLPSGSSGDERQQAKYRFLATFGPWLDDLMREHKDTGREFVICGDWNIAQGNRPEELEKQPEELRLLARRTRLVDRGVRQARLHRRVPHPGRTARPIHLVEQPRPGLGQERGVAHRLPDRHAGHRGARA